MMMSPEERYRVAAADEALVVEGGGLTPAHSNLSKLLIEMSRYLNHLLHRTEQSS